MVFFKDQETETATTAEKSREYLYDNQSKHK